MGQRYTPEEIKNIQVLIDEGYTNIKIETRLGRTPAGMRASDTERSSEQILQNPFNQSLRACRFLPDLPVLCRETLKLLMK